MSEHRSAIFDDESFDFIERFPRPQDERMREAGRDGLLDQKESDELSDAQWVGLLHDAWSEELAILLTESRRLERCLARGIDPGSGRAPRRAERWATLAADLQERQQLLRGRCNGALSHYRDHFGATAAAKFAAFVEARAAAESAVDAQGELFG